MSSGILRRMHMSSLVKIGQVVRSRTPDCISAIYEKFLFLARSKPADYLQAVDYCREIENCEARKEQGEYPGNGVTKR